MAKQQDKLDQAARAAWLYYVAGKNQNEVAEQLNVSRQVAQRLLASAVEGGLVKVSVQHPVADCLELAAALQARFGLTLCEVVPKDMDSPAELQHKLAVAGGRKSSSAISPRTSPWWWRLVRGVPSRPSSTNCRRWIARNTAWCR
jgi:DNA-binding transcriptional regulator LsrR (DeoR family)